MYKVKTYNEHQIKAMLESGKMQYENFYKDELITFLKFSVKENKKLKNANEKFIKWLEKEKKQSKPSEPICKVVDEEIVDDIVYDVFREVLDKFRGIIDE